jgi:predicted RNase H-like HicB family nuclease
VEQARGNLQEALKLFFETASAQEIEQRMRGEVFITQVEVAVG